MHWLGYMYIIKFLSFKIHSFLFENGSDPEWAQQLRFLIANIFFCEYAMFTNIEKSFVLMNKFSYFNKCKFILKIYKNQIYA